MPTHAFSDDVLTMSDVRIEALCNWFRRSQRDLPWRRRRCGYTALVAEAMLQQTQVTRVVERFESFIDELPDIASLAAADEQHVLRLWNGLGYYRRARNLHAAAKRIVEHHDGEVPMNPAALQRLPGVGPYTAGAIASIVGGAAEPIVDGNVRRVLLRWFGDDGKPHDRMTTRRCWDRAGDLVREATEPGEFNEALMELGALICTTKSPQCAQCPVARWCEAHRQGRQNELPITRAGVPTPVVYHHAVVIIRRNTVLLEQRIAEGLWARLWQPPTVESAHRLRRSTIERRLPMRVERLTEVDEFAFQTSSRRVVFRLFTALSRVRSGRWQSIDRLDSAPMSNAHRRVFARVLQLGPPAST